jgi:hypothetical protein
MNERLKELLEEATEIHDDRGTGISHPVVDQKVFAELIVRECSQYIEDKFDFCGDELIIAEKLREHFGVEE